MIWPHLRAALIALHVLAVALLAFPAPSGTGLTLSVDDPNFASDVRPWARLFGAEDRAFAKRIIAVRSTWLSTRGRVVAPFERYLSLVGAQQNWHMFSSPNRAPTHFVLEVRRALLADDSADWQFFSGLPAGQWRRDFFQSERTRGLLNFIGRYDHGELSDAFCLHVAREILAERDEWAQVRCQFIQAPAPSLRPTQSPHMEPHAIYSRVVGR